MRALFFAASTCVFLTATALQTPKPLTYKDVAPTLKTNCVGCHSGPKAAHGLDLSTYAAIIKGDKEGKVVVPRSAQKSRLAKVLHGKPMLMPPGAKLVPGKIKIIEDWIKAGAKK